MTRSKLPLILSFAAMIVAPQPGNAQAARQTASLASSRGSADCASAAAAARAGRGSEKRIAFSRLTGTRCRAEAPDALAAAWSTVGLEDLEQLRGATSRLADRRLLEAMTELAMNESTGRSTRLAALGVLVSYAEPSAYAQFNAAPDSPPAVIGDRTDFAQASGEQPLSSADRAGVVDRLSRVAASGGDERVRQSAAALANQLRQRLLLQIRR